MLHLIWLKKQFPTAGMVWHPCWHAPDYRDFDRFRLVLWLLDASVF
jgi:hypothetical protein